MNQETNNSKSINELYMLYLAWEHARKDVSHVVKKYLADNHCDVMDFIITGNLNYAENIRKEIISEIDNLIEKAEYIITYTDNKQDCNFWREYVSELYTLTGREVPDHHKCTSHDISSQASYYTSSFDDTLSNA